MVRVKKTIGPGGPVADRAFSNLSEQLVSLCVEVPSGLPADDLPGGPPFPSRLVRNGSDEHLMFRRIAQNPTRLNRDGRVGQGTNRRGAGRIRTGGHGFADRCRDSITSETGNNCGADSGSLPLPCHPTTVKHPPDLALVVERWEKLPVAVRAGIVAMVKASVSQ
jgi:hypothetical protein